MDDDIQVELADGTILSFPAGTADEVIDAKVREMLGVQQPAREPLRRPAVVRAAESAMDFLGSESERAEKAREIVGATMAGEQTFGEGALQTAGMGVNYLGEKILDLLTPVARAGKSAVQAITPDALEDEIITQMGIFFDQPIMKLGKQALQAGGEQWAQFSQEHPRAARNIEAVTQIAEVGVPSRMAGTRVSRMLPEGPSARQRAEMDIEAGGVRATRGSTAPYRMEDAPAGQLTYVGREGPMPTQVPMRMAVRNPAQAEAIRQGFDEGLVAMIREASPADRENMLRSLRIMQEATANKRFSMLNRTTDIAGESILKRYNLLKEKNLQSGRGIDEFAKKNMTNDYVDFTGAVDNFQNNLENMGIRINDDLSLDFSGSTIKGLSGIENFLSRVVERMASPRDLTSYEVHNFKRFIDEQVNYGKELEGLSGRAESVVRELRADLDRLLDNRYPEYDRLNTTYSDTINAIDDFQSAIGRSIDLDSRNAATAIGTSLRGLGSNRQTRGRLLDSLAEMETISRRYGGNFDDDVINQTAFTIDLDRVFGTKADTSFAGQAREAIETADVPTSRRQLFERVGTAAFNKLRGVNQEAQFRAMENLLRSFD